MNRARIVLVSVVMCLMMASSLPLVTSSQTPSATPVTTGNEDPVSIVGQAGSASGLAGPAMYPDPSVVLIDVAGLTHGDYAFVPDDGQILGVWTTPLFPMPGEFRVDLPVVPHASTIDLDNDAEADGGVQVFAIVVSSNLIGNSYLQQIEQFAGFTSYLTDNQTGLISQGDFVVYAADDAQAFPSHWGADGQWFTSDDSTTALEQGYTVVRLGADGVAGFERNSEVTINTMEAPELAVPDFSSQGILESYHSLIDHLSVRYAYTDFAGIDWEVVRATYLPEVEAADASQDMAAYYHVLVRLARSIQDPHVDVRTLNPDLALAPDPALQSVSANLGASVIAITDPDHPDQAPGDTILVLTVGEDTPAERAGWVPGTEIITVDGKSVSERFAEIPLLLSAGTEETRRLTKQASFLSFADGQEVTVQYRLPESEEIQSATLVAGDYLDGAPFILPTTLLPISLVTDQQYTIVRWTDFVRSVEPKIAVMEEALAGANSGIILDLRGNTGGWEELEDILASFFFTADHPLQLPVFDYYEFDASANDLVKMFQPEMALTTPKPDLAYTLPVVILVDNNCVSACEYFTQELQTLGRATVVGQYGTIGGGGNIGLVSLPGDIMMQFTVGRSTFVGTDEFNIQGRGVTLDLRVPVTLESELAKLQGEDPVMDAAKLELDRQLEALYAAEEPAATPGAGIEASPVASPVSEGDGVVVTTGW